MTSPKLLALIVLCAGLVAPAIAYAVYAPIRAPERPALIGGAFGALAAAVWVVSTTRGGPWTERVPLALLLGLLAGFALRGWVGGLLMALNGAFDRTAGVATAALVERIGPGRRDYVRITAGPLAQTVFYVGKHALPTDHHRERAGAPLTLVVHPGALGYPWYESLR